MPIRSPLDRDYFDLLQRFDPISKDAATVKRVVAWAQALPFEYWRSMEQSFYTLQSRSHLANKLGVTSTYATDGNIVTSFVNATGALLRAAHGKKSCAFHKKLVENMTEDDSIMTFNYDLVMERALKEIPEISAQAFGPWVYGQESSKTPPDWDVPCLLKLHGSFSWGYPEGDDETFSMRIKSWDDLEEAPGFKRFGSEKTEFPIFLPFWDKRIERQPWLEIWRKAYERLSKCTGLVIWGYSLPKTDLKAYQLFSLAQRNNMNICVIDPSSDTRDRWRKLFQSSKFWEYSFIEEFLTMPPDWWDN